MSSFESIDRLLYRAESPLQQFVDASTYSQTPRDQRREPKVTPGKTPDSTQEAGVLRQLTQFQRMEAISRVTGGIAHNVNNLLTGIIGFCHLLTDDSTDEDTNGIFLAKILGSANHAADLVKQLLAFSQQQIQSPQNLDMNHVVAACTPRVQQMAGEDVEVVIDLESAAKSVRVDPKQIEQVITNLAANAVEAMPDGGLLTLRTRHLDLDGFSVSDLGIPKGAYVLLEVEDTGAGIDESIYDQIFEPFFSTKKDLNGTGLGLSVVYGIVKQCGGQIRVESISGRGTRFRIYLPRVESRAEAAPPTSSRTDEVPAKTASERGVTILLAEDDPTIRQVLKAFLAKQGYRVLVARDGAEGLDLSSRYTGEIDLLLTDIVMPRIDGLELAQTMLAQRASTKVLFISGYAQEREVLCELLEGVEVDFMKKPFEPESLEVKLQQMLRPTLQPCAPDRRLPRAAA